MLKENIAKIFARDLHKLQQEIEAYEDENMIWQINDGISNSAGNLCLHLVGNLNTYIGSILGNTGYIRNRDQEFLKKNIPKTILLEEINKVTAIIETTFNSLTDESLVENYPSEVLGYPMSTQYFLIHLIGHLNYHLGQVNYHRRILTGLQNAI